MAEAKPLAGAGLRGQSAAETAFSQHLQASIRLLAVTPSILLYWYQFSHHGRRIETATDDNSIAAHFLHLLTGKPPAEIHTRVMHTSLVLYAEHEFNASTFT